MREREPVGDAERAGTRPWRILTAIAMTMALIATVLSVVVANRASRIGDQLAHSNATLIAQESDEAADTSPTTALRMALAAYREKPDSPEAYGALLEQRLYWRGVDRIFEQAGEPDTIQSSADGEVILVLPRDPSADVTVWHDLTSAEPKRRDIPVASPSALSLSPNGRWLAEPQGSAVRLWDLTIDRPPRTLRSSETPQVEAVDFSPDGRYLSVRPVEHGDTEVAVPVWDTESDEWLPSGVRTGGAVTVTQAHPSRDGTELVTHEESPDGQRTVVRDRASGSLKRSFGADVLLGFGAAAAHCDNGVISVRDTRTGQSRGRRSGMECPVRWDVSQQYLLLTEQDQQAQNYTEAIHWPSWRRHVFSEPARQRALGTTPLLFSESEGSLTSLMISDGTLRSNTLHTSEKADEVVRTSPKLTDRYPPRRRTVSYTDAGKLALLKPDGEVLRRTGVPEAIDALSFDSAGKHVLTVAGDTLRIYDTKRLTLEHEKSLPGSGGLRRMTSSASILPWASDEALVVRAGKLTYWNPRTGRQTSEPLRLANGDSKQVGTATLRPRHSQVLVEHGDQLSLWDFEKRKLVHTFPVELFDRTEPVFDSSGSTTAVITGVGDEIALFDLDREVRLRGIDAKVSDIHGISERYLFLESALDFQMWDWRQRKLVTSIRLDDGYREGRREIVHHDRFDELVTDATPGHREALTLEAENWYRGLCAVSDRAFTRAELRLLPAGVSTEPPCSGVLRGS